MGMNINGNYFRRPMRLTEEHKERIKNSKPEYQPQTLTPQPKPEKKPTMQPLRQPMTKEQLEDFKNNLDLRINNPDIPDSWS